MNIMDHNLAAVDYHAMHNTHVSSSMLSHLKRSPAHLKYVMENPEPPTPQMITGSIIHTAVLESDVFNTTYVRAPEGDRRRKETKLAYAELEEEGWEKDHILTPASYDQAIGMREAIESHPIASKLLLTGYGVPTEISLLWTDERTGVKCRGRADALPDRNRIVDYKTTTDASAEKFSRSVHSFGYHRQGSFYMQGINTIEDIPTTREFIIVAQEKNKPYAISVFQLDDDTLEQGNAEVEELLDIYKKCVDDDAWPSYPQEIQSLSLPRYAFTQ